MTVSVELSDDVLSLLAAEAARCGLTVGQVAAALLAEALDGQAAGSS